MAWENSNRRSRLPKNWASIRREVLFRDLNRCQFVEASGLMCNDHATEVDHIVPGDNHSKSNLRAICSWHHARKSSEEGRRAREAKAAERKRAEKKQHPGMQPKR